MHTTTAMFRNDGSSNFQILSEMKLFFGITALARREFKESASLSATTARTRMSKGERVPPHLQHDISGKNKRKRSTSQSHHATKLKFLIVMIHFKMILLEVAAYFSMLCRCLKCLQQVKHEYSLIKNKLETLFNVSSKQKILLLPNYFSKFL